MKGIFSTIIIFLSQALYSSLWAQCSICTRNAQQLGDKAAAGLNLSILFLAFTPLILIGYIGYRWYRGEKASREEEAK